MIIILVLDKILERKYIELSFEEFFALERNEITLSSVYFNRKCNRMLNRICNRNKQIEKVVILFLAFSFLIYENVYASQVDVSKINNLGSTLLTLIQTIGYWFCIIMASKDILTSLMQNQCRDIGSIILKHILAFGGFYALPWSFNLIKDLLS